MHNINIDNNNLLMTETKDFFELFGLEKVFDLDLSALEKKYIMMQSIMHPDRFFTPHEKTIAFEKSVAINNAYEILKSPLKRGKHLLYLLYGIDDFVPTNEVLVELFSLQKEIDSAKNPLFLKKIQEKYLNNLKQSFEDANILLSQKSIFFLNYLLKL